MAESTNNRMMGATLLVAGTTVGAGMLALPISTGVSGYAVSMATFFLCFAFIQIQNAFKMQKLRKKH